MAYSKADKERDVRLLDLAEKRYNFEIQRLKDLDTKASNLIGYVSVITTLILGIGAFQFLNDNLIEKSYSFFYFIGIFALVVSITLSLIAMAVRKYEFAPVIDNLKVFYRSPEIPEMNIIRHTIENMNNAAIKNFHTNNQKGFHILVSNLMLIAGIVFLLSYTIAFAYEEIIIGPKEKTSVKTFSQLDNKTLIQFLNGQKKVEVNPDETFKIISPVSPHTKLPWIGTQFQWLKDNLNVYIITDLKSNSDEGIAEKSVSRWISLLKSKSNNSSSWNVTIYKINEDDYKPFKIHNPDIVIHLDSDPEFIDCTKYFGEADLFHEDKYPQYAKIIVSCKGERLTNESIYSTVLHEFAHTIGLGHAHNKQSDLLCSEEVEKQTCSILPDDNADVSDFDLNAAIYLYGKDGFGAFNRILVSKNYYVEPEVRLNQQHGS